ncbi:hypothetical protein D3C78_1111530 [compost metagenome]
MFVKDALVSSLRSLSIGISAAIVIGELRSTSGYARTAAGNLHRIALLSFVSMQWDM